MEYPGTKLTRNVRHGILIAFIAVFCLITPAVILYTEGYRYDFNRGLWRETGALSVDVLPRSAQVFLNGALIPQTLPIRLQDVTPGKYRLKIIAPGYYDWTRDLTVSKRQTEYIKDISLIKKETPVKIADDNAVSLAVSLSGRYLAYITISGELRLYDTLAATNTFKLALNGADQWQLSWSVDDYLAVSDARPPHKHLYLIKADTGKTTDLALVNKDLILKYQWKNAPPAEMYFADARSVFSYQPAADARRVLIDNAPPDWRFENSQFWSLDVLSSTGKIQLTKDILGLKSQFALIEQPGASSTLRAAAGNRALIQLPNEQKMLLITDGEQYRLPVTNFLESPYSQWWLMWSNWELWAHASGEKEPQLLTRSGEGLKDVQPLDNYNTLALFWNDRVTALFPYYLVAHTILDRGVGAASVDSKNKIMYFGDDEGVWKLNY